MTQSQPCVLHGRNAAAVIDKRRQITHRSHKVRYQELEATHCTFCNKKLKEGEEVYVHVYAPDYTLRLAHLLCEDTHKDSEQNDG